MKKRELLDRVLATPDSFSASWLAEGGKHQAPLLPDQKGIGRRTVERMLRGTREVSAGHILVTGVDGVTGEEPVGQVPPLQDDVLAQVARSGAAVLLVTADFGGALLARPEYGLVAGTAPFLRAALPEGFHRACAEFDRYARRVRHEMPSAAAIAERFPAARASWEQAKQVPADSHVGEQLRLMEALVHGEVSGPDFARQWLGARRSSLELGERTRGRLTRALDEVFYALEDYAIDPAQREPGDLTDEGLRERVASALEH
ncbi:colicin immunity domain-containing protein [Streptomyces sp. NPDC023998]|uniref:colicin immunity domain-containing protein n=1 Tax=unclassified Streptomyces TaxID=2593676 RepID=UPI00324DFB61